MKQRDISIERRITATTRLRAACDQFAAAMGDAANVLGRDNAHAQAVSFLGRDLGSARGLDVGPREGERRAVKLFSIARVNGTPSTDGDDSDE